MGYNEVIILKIQGNIDGKAVFKNYKVYIRFIYNGYRKSKWF